MSCEEFHALGAHEREPDDLVLMRLAEAQRWRRCPVCMVFVEKTEGCPHISCRCGHEFCHGCGSAWSQSHYNCQNN
ncbi:hypothetical protein QJS10_CPB19g01982 [Acorus calamus]|uniref:RBR-type E3 ubiquitin transferase n=1 Tax=Acorus calamus TaxID=4465 RepID=A0AAV9CE07_ACOCL|nr:hypothetical protein QJS10_CPB19g01982 [Acorus calamus]